MVPLFTPDEVEHYRTRLLVNDLPAMPEFAHPVTKYVDGGFGALANPSSFHMETVRELRREIATRTWSFFQLLSTYEHRAPRDDWRLEQLIDRLALRPRGSSTSKEVWHRDQSPTKDTVFGGWVNLDVPSLGGPALRGTQYFSCNPGTHRSSPDQVGFVQIPTDTPAFAAANAARTAVAIPPGHWVVFFQNLVHEVYARKMKYDSLRLFVGFRLTKSTRPLFDQVKPGNKPEERKAFAGFHWRTSVFDEQGTPPIPSSQYPPMWSASTLNFRKPQLVAWSAELVPPYQQPDKGYPVRFMQSLQKAGLPMYPAYDEADIAIHSPRRLMDD